MGYESWEQDTLIDQDLTGVEELGSSETVPAGTYRAYISSAVVKRDENENKYIALTWSINAGDFLGCSVQERSYMSHKISDKAVNFGRSKLKSIAVAIKHPNPNYIRDTDELINRECAIIVGFGKNDYKDRNQINNYLTLEEWGKREDRQAASEENGSASSPPSPPPAGTVKKDDSANASKTPPAPPAKYKAAPASKRPVATPPAQPVAPPPPAQPAAEDDPRTGFPPVDE